MRMVIREPAIYLLRGPLIFTGVFLAWIVPFLATLSPTFILQLSLALTGFLFFCHDLYRFTENKTRITLRNLLDRVVLDDVLRAIHDPETGIIACMVGNFLGTSSMYTLKMNPTQRAKLVQSGLWITESDARTVLLSPGGCKSLLPAGVQQWLAKEDDSDPSPKPAVEEYADRDEGDSFSSASICESPSDDMESVSSEGQEIRSRSLPSFGESGEEAGRHTKPDGNDDGTKCFQSDLPKSIPVDPVTVMMSILGEMAREKIRPYVQSIPEPALEAAGTVASLALMAQLGLRRRSKTSALGTISAVSLSGVAIGAFLTVLARHVALGNIRCAKTFKQVGAQMTKRILSRLKDTAMYNGRWRTTLAMIVLLWVGGRKKRSLSRR